MNRFIGAIKKGVAGVQDAYNRQKKAADERAKREMASAKTKYEKERIKAELEREKLQLQREMYEAKAAVQREKAAVAKARREAGVVSLGERAEGFAKRLYYGPPKRKPTKRRKR